MEQNIELLLLEEIQSEIEKIKMMDIGSNEKSKAIDDLVKLYKLKLDETKSKLEIDNNNRDNYLKQYQFIDSIIDKSINLILDISKIALPLIFYAAWMDKGFKFEETGVYTSGTFKNLFNRFKPTN